MRGYRPFLFHEDHNILKIYFDFTSLSLHRKPEWLVWTCNSSPQSKVEKKESPDASWIISSQTFPITRFLTKHYFQARVFLVGNISCLLWNTRRYVNWTNTPLVEPAGIHLVLGLSFVVHLSIKFLIVYSKSLNFFHFCLKKRGFTWLHKAIIWVKFTAPTHILARSPTIRRGLEWPQFLN